MTTPVASTTVATDGPATRLGSRPARYVVIVMSEATPGREGGGRGQREHLSVPQAAERAPAHTQARLPLYMPLHPAHMPSRQCAL